MYKYYNIYLCALFFLLCVSYSLCDHHWLAEGASCMDGTINGTCMTAHTCKTRDPSRPIHDYPICSIARRRRIICCAHQNEYAPLIYSDKLVTDPITKQPLNKTGQKAWDKCLDYLRDVNYPCKRINRMNMNHVSAGLHNIGDKNWGNSEHTNKSIAGGENARRIQFPHMALLGYGNETNKSVAWMCGGSLISDRFILTAGNCIAHIELGPVKYIGLGMLKRNDPPSMWQRHRVQRIIAHPDYHPPIKYNDIALLQTARRVTFGPVVAPACLAIQGPPHEQSTLSQMTVSATGWGIVGQGNNFSDNLKMVDLKEFTYEDCARIYKVHRHLPQGYNTTTQVCYGDKSNTKDTCQGDGGGPLQIPGQASICQHSIIGITSFGNSCPSEAGMYTRVLPFLPWIESIVWP